MSHVKSTNSSFPVRLFDLRRLSMAGLLLLGFAAGCNEPQATIPVGTHNHISPIFLEDVEVVEFTPRLIEREDGRIWLHLFVEDQDLTAAGGAVEHQLRDLDSFTMRIGDFSTDGTQFRVTAFTVGSGGELTPWPRDGNVNVSEPFVPPPGANDDAFDIPFVVIAAGVDGYEVFSDPYPCVIIPPMAPPLRTP